MLLILMRTIIFGFIFAYTFMSTESYADTLIIAILSILLCGISLFEGYGHSKNSETKE